MSGEGIHERGKSTEKGLQQALSQDRYQQFGPDVDIFSVFEYAED
jgi:hypothetical protein